MSTDPLTLQVGLPYAYRGEAAQIYFAAFQRKLRPFLGGLDRFLFVFVRDVHADQAIIALQGGKLIGLAGLQHRRRPFLDPQWRTFVEEYSAVQALVRYPIARMMHRPAAKGELLIDSLSVDAAARGQGVGSRLIEAAFGFARQQGYASVGLDVVDTNPRARALYERVGFVVTGRHPYPYLRRSLGFGAVFSMSCPLKEKA